MSEELSIPNAFDAQEFRFRISFGSSVMTIKIADIIDIGCGRFAVNAAHICTLFSSTSDKYLSSHQIYVKQDGG